MTRVAVPGDGNGLLIDCSAAQANACELEAKHQCPNGYHVVASKPDQLTIECRFSSPAEDTNAPALSTTTRDQPGKPPRIDEDASLGTVVAPTDGTPAPTTSLRGPEPLGTIYGLSLGGGVVETTEKQEPRAPAEGSGWGFTGSALVARELLPGFALGGIFSFQQLSTLKMDYWDTDNTVSLAFLGPDLEVLACSTNCIRFGGACGVTILSAPELSDVQNSIRRYGARDDTATIPADSNSLSASFGYDLHLTYELKVAPTWYTGFGFRLLGAGISSDRSVIGYSLLLDVLNH